LVPLACSSAGSDKGGQKIAATQATQPTPDASTTLDLTTGVLTKDSLQRFVGRQITVIGFWNGGGGHGKPGERIYGGRKSIIPVYCVAENIYVTGSSQRGWKILNDLLNNIADETPVELTGVLRYTPGWK